MSSREIQELTSQTLEMMRILDSTEEFADCILWTGATTQQGYPIYKPTGCGCTLVRRSVFKLNGGAVKDRQPVVTTCNERLCINPAHMVASTCQSVAKAAGRAGAFSGKTRCAKIAASKRLNSKLNIELAIEIRLSPISTRALAKLHSVNRSVIIGIKAGRMWKDYTNPFAGLMI